MGRVLAVLLAWTTGCSDRIGPTAVPTGPTGTLTISVTGLLGSAASGGWASVLRTDVRGQTPHGSSIPPNGSVDLTVVAGTYNVTYAAPSGYRARDPGPMTALVPASGAATVAFDVFPDPSVVVIVVNVLTAPYPATGGSASILRTDIDGQTPLSVDIPNQATEGYYAAVSVLPGAYAVTYTPPTGYKLAAGVTNARADISVMPGASSIVTFDVTPDVTP